MPASRTDGDLPMATMALDDLDRHPGISFQSPAVQPQ
jgi:hypothetical protein